MSLTANAHYALVCPRCGASYPDDGKIITCAGCAGDGQSSILAFTPASAPAIDPAQDGVRRYTRFLPVNNLDCLRTDLTITWKSEKFAKRHGLRSLYFTATGYAPAKGIQAASCSFKELEALVVLNRLRSHGVDMPLVVASAGNTARAFAYYGAKLEYPVIIVAPSASRRYLWLPDEPGLYEKSERFVKAIFVDTPGKYLHASLLAKHIAQAMTGRVLAEGGYFNVGRLSGLGICALNYYDLLGSVPDHYVQAVGSAAGVLAAMRTYDLLQPGSSKGIVYHLVQNIPYTPLVKAIEERQNVVSSDMYPNIDTVCSPMLTSADPAYSHPGGLLQEMLAGTKLIGYGVTNQDIYNLQYEIWSTEGVSVLLPAAAAIGGLLQGIKAGTIGRDQVIQVNLTGLGSIACMADKGFFYVPSALGAQVPEVVSYGGSAFTQWFDQNKGLLCWT